MLTTLLIDVTHNKREVSLTHKHQPKTTISYLVGDGGGEARSEVICSIKANKTPMTSFENQSPRRWTKMSSNLWDLWFRTLLLSAMLYGRGRKVLTLCGGSNCSSSDSGVSVAGDTSLSSWPVLVLLALDRRRELEGRGRIFFFFFLNRIFFSSWLTRFCEIVRVHRQCKLTNVDFSWLTSRGDPACWDVAECRRKGTSLSCHGEFLFIPLSRTKTLAHKWAKCKDFWYVNIKWTPSHQLTTHSGENPPPDRSGVGKLFEWWVTMSEQEQMDGVFRWPSSYASTFSM